MAETESDRDAVGRVIRRWGRAFSTVDSDALIALWDETYPDIIYQAEEFPDPFRGFDQVKYYYGQIPTFAHNIRDQSLVDLDIDVLGDVAWVYLRGTVTFDIPGKPEPISGEARQSFILRKVGGEWKIIHYHESRETPDLAQYLQHAHP